MNGVKASLKLLFKSIKIVYLLLVKLKSFNKINVTFYIIISPKFEKIKILNYNLFTPKIRGNTVLLLLFEKSGHYITRYRLAFHIYRTSKN